MSASTATGERHLDVVHVSCDFPDPIVAFKTPVIRTLLELTQNDFSHRVYSLNRQSPSALSFAKSVIAGLGKPSLMMRAQPFEWGEAIEYEAPGRGLFLATFMRQVGEKLAADLRACGRVPDLLVAHKLSIEGIAVQRAAFLLDRPYALSIQGDTDTKVLAARPDLKRAFAGIFHGAAMVFPFAPWSLRQVEGSLGVRSGPCIALPCPTDLDEPLPPLAGGEGLITAFHLKNHARKNLKGMVAGLRLLDAEGFDARLGVIGGGNEAQVDACRDIVVAHAGTHLEGALDRSALRQRMRQARAFICPSLRESFGLVFIEALFAGLPIVYPKGTAVDGYFDGHDFAIAVDARAPRSIAQGMRRAIEEEAQLKASLARWQGSAEARRFQRTSIGEAFASGLRTAVTAG